MTEMSPASREALHHAIADAHLTDRCGIDTGPLARLDQMTEEEALQAIDEVYRQIHFD